MLQIFTRFLRGLRLPVGSGNLNVTPAMDNYEMNYCARWFVSMMVTRTCSASSAVT